MLVLALESSTSSAKAILYDSAKGVIDICSKRYDPQIGGDGITDTDGVLRLTLEAGKTVAQGKDIAAIAICGTWHSIAICDKNLQPVSKTYSWNYMLPSESCRSIRKNEQLTAELYNRTGCMPHVTYPRQTLLYLQEQGYVFNDKLFISQGAYNFFKLTGVFCESRSTVSGSGLLNIHALEYDDFVLDLLQIKKEQLGQLVSYQEIQPLNEFGANILGVSRGIPVVPAHPDGALNQVSSGAGSVDRMTISIGTSAALRLTSDHPFLPENRQLWCYYGVTDWIVGAATAGAGNCINWFVQQCCGNRWTFEELETSPEVWESTPVFLPFLFGERCPGWQDERLGGFYAIKASHSIHDMYRAVQASILFNLFQCFEVIRQIRKPKDLIVSGGILNSRQWVQMMADIFQSEVKCVKNLHASSTGAAILGFHAAGAIKDIKTFETDYEGAVRIPENPESAGYYTEQYQRYLHWYEITR